ncbi:hypothetical protein ACOMHN_026925 [Nucella lapillus]
MTHVLREPPHMTHVLSEPSHMTHVLREPPHMTHVLREPSHMTHVLKEPSHMTHVLREPSHMTHVLREPSHMTHVLREPSHMTHVLREPPHMTHVLREPSHMTHVLREPSHMTHVLREPSHMTHLSSHGIISLVLLGLPILVHSGVNCLSRDMVQNLVDCWCAYLREGVVRGLETGAQRVAVSHIVTAISALLACYDLIPMPAALLQEDNYPTWHDLRPSQAQDVAGVGEELADEMEVETVCECLRGLALSPKECAPAWKAHVFLQALSDRRQRVKEAAVQMFPLLLFRLGHNFLHLIRQCLQPLAEDPSHQLQKVVATVLGDLVCVAAHTVHLHRGGVGDKPCAVSELCWIQCAKCTGQGDDKASRQIDPKLFAPFLMLLKSPDADVRKNTVRQMRLVFKCVPVVFQTRHSEADEVGV